MKYIVWDGDKNDLLLAKRGVGFAQVMAAVFSGNVLAEGKNPNQKKHPNQKMWVVEIKRYAYVVPFVEDEVKIFLKTVFPSRKYTRELIEKGNL
ncbi:MAG: toxin [Patescibacteria group bacterium]